MAKQGKKAHADRPREWKISIPSSVAAPVELLLSDPVTGKPKHGARARLITKLLQEWLADRGALGYDSNLRKSNRDTAGI